MTIVYRLLGFVVIFACLLTNTMVPTAQAVVEQITSFHSDITINTDNSITITEIIDYTTQAPKHGIYRYIPTKLSNGWLVEHTTISDVVVADENGQPQPFEEFSEDGNYTLKIGKPDQTFTGKETYLISYTVANAIDWHDDQPELYWDITGDGWSFPISSASTTITTPTDITQLTCFVGPDQSQQQNCTSQQLSDQSVTFNATMNISSNDNFTVVVGLTPTATFSPPSQLRELTTII